MSAIPSPQCAAAPPLADGLSTSGADASQQPGNAPLAEPLVPPVPLGVLTSPELGDLFAALSEAQGTLTDLAATGTNEGLGTRHLTLSGVLSGSRQALKAQGLCVVQCALGTHVRTILGHKSGQFIQCDTPLLLSRSDLLPMQALASAVSFARRIALTSMIGVAQADDDGQTTGMPTGASRPALAAVSTIAGASGASPGGALPRRGFSLQATIDAINAKTSVEELDDAKTRVEAAFTGESLKDALRAIDSRRQIIITASNS